MLPSKDNITKCKSQKKLVGVATISPSFPITGIRALFLLYEHIDPAWTYFIMMVMMMFMFIVITSMAFVGMMMVFMMVVMILIPGLNAEVRMWARQSTADAQNQQ